jgi:uncharacterized membrane protein (UPF0136 family)
LVVAFAHRVSTLNHSSTRRNSHAARHLNVEPPPTKATLEMSDQIGVAYGLLVAFGGLMGGMKGSYVWKVWLTFRTISLLAGGGMGLAIMYSAHRNDTKSLLYLAVALTALMGIRFGMSGKFMPAGLVSILSLLMAIRYNK